MSDITIREATFEDYPSISDLMKKYHLTCPPYEQWKHLWTANPAIIDKKLIWNPGWVLEHQTTKAIVGFLANICLEYYYNDRAYTASIASSWVVDMPFRKQNILLSEAYFNQTQPQLFLNTTAISATGRIFTNFEGAKVPTPDYDTSLFWITKSFGFAKSLLMIKKIPLPQVFAFPAAWGLSVLSALKKLTQHKISDKKFEYLENFDERFETFWNKLKKKPDTLICRKDQQTLNWHFKFPIQEKKLWIMVDQVDNIIKSYAIFLRQDTDTYSLNRMRLVDFQSLYKNSETLTQMVKQATRRCEAEGIHMLEVVGFDEKKRKSLKVLNPFTRQLPSWMFYYKAADPELKKALENVNVWDPNSYDGDGSL